MCVYDDDRAASLVVDTCVCECDDDKAARFVVGMSVCDDSAAVWARRRNDCMLMSLASGHLLGHMINVPMYRCGHLSTGACSGERARES